jgi:fermentation-respiration switch protein FrsA (DUF1100 family)
MPEFLGPVLRLLALLLSGYALLNVVARLMAPAMLFPRPAPGYVLTPDFVRLPTPDGAEVICRHWSNPAAEFTLLWFHGNGEDLGGVSSYIPPYVAAGFSVLAVEYRGYGLSRGTPSEAAIHADAKVAYDWLRRQGAPADRIILFGYSLGGGPAVELATRERVAGLVLESCFVSAYRVITRGAFLVGDMFENLKKLPRVSCPVLVIHGTADQVVPFWHGEKLFAAAVGQKTKLFVEGAGHGDVATLAKDNYWQALRDFRTLCTPPVRH